eukprot:TRINITY_DN11826_c0_g1_i1.p1 TRINITY_DN11826_c0_g1~~TRINITY_DN11826_c0_g1_i1.p1  ORF type:complete len:253 (-),score=43.64 TRINITY_DN11826_c0_g1_i1:40-798(-)
MKYLVCLGVLLLVVVSAEYGRDCARSGERSLGEDDDHFYANQDSCDVTSKDGKYCVFSNPDDDIDDGSDREYSCVQCISDCDCELGEFCQNTHSKLSTLQFGKCHSYKDRVGESCVPLDDSNAQNVYFGSDNACWLYDTYVDNDAGITNQRVVVWSGSCIEGTCRECNSYLMPGVSHVSVDDDSGDSISQYYNIQRKQNVMCTGFTSSENSQLSANSRGVGTTRACKNFEWVYASSISLLPCLFAIVLALLF